MTNEAWQDDEDEWLDDEEAPPPPPRRWPILAAFGVALVFAASAWYALWNAGGVSPEGGPPLIQADTSPVKQKPADPGGLQIPYQEKLVYERLQPPPAGPTLAQPPQIAQAPEQPAKRPEPAPEPEPTPTPTPASPAAAEDADKPAATAPMVADATPTTPPAASSAPATVTAVAPPTPADTGQADAATDDAAADATASAPPAPVPAPPTTAPTDTQTAPSPPAPADSASASGDGDTAAADDTTADAAPTTSPLPSVTVANRDAILPNQPPTPAVKPTLAPSTSKPGSGTLSDVARVLSDRDKQQPAAVAPAAAPPSTAAPAQAQTKSGYRIQVAASRSEAAARTAWNRIQGRNRSILGGLDLHLRRVNIIGKGVYYRVQAGPFAGADEAGAACQKLRANRQDCLIVRP